MYPVVMIYGKRMESDEWTLHVIGTHFATSAISIAYAPKWVRFVILSARCIPG